MQNHRTGPVPERTSAPEYRRVWRTPARSCARRCNSWRRSRLVRRPAMRGTKTPPRPGAPTRRRRDTSSPPPGRRKMRRAAERQKRASRLSVRVYRL